MLFSNNDNLDLFLAISLLTAGCVQSVSSPKQSRFIFANFDYVEPNMRKLISKHFDNMTFLLHHHEVEIFGSK